MSDWDVIVIGGGTAGLMTAIFAARRGARVLVLEAAAEIGGTLHLSSGRMSAAGTQFQRANGIEDSPDAHYDDVMRICRDTADPVLVRLAVELAAETFDWIVDAGLVLATPAPVLGSGLHEPYTRERYAWGVELGRSILKAIAPQFWAQVASGRVALKLRTRAETLTYTQTEGAVTGVRTRDDSGRSADYRGANVVVASGGFGANAQMMVSIHRTPLYSVGAWRHALGDGIRMAMDVGAGLRGAQHYHANFGAILASYDYPADIIATAQTSPQTRAPWEIYVDSRGERFINECEPSIDTREHALIGLADRRYWIVFDEAILSAAPPLIMGWSVQDIRAAFGHHPMFVAADSLDELAHRTGMQPATLATTVERYNGALNGIDPLGRDHRPRPIARAPFFAIRQHCTIVVTSAGLAVDGQLRVLDANGKAISNLYAAGEVLGSAATMGGSASNGMLVTPALAFGRLLGEKILRWPTRSADGVH